MRNLRGTFFCMKNVLQDFHIWISVPLMPFNHSASNCMKSLIICSKSAKVTSKQCSNAILIGLFFRIKLFKVIHSVERKTSWKNFLIFLLANERFYEC